MFENEVTLTKNIPIALRAKITPIVWNINVKRYEKKKD